LTKLTLALRLFAVTFLYATSVVFVVTVVFGAVFTAIHWAFPSLHIYHGFSLARLVLSVEVSAWAGFVAGIMSCAQFLFDIDVKKK